MVFLECTDSSFNDIGRKDDLAAETAAAERAALDQVVDLFVIDPELASEFMSPSLGERRTRTRPLGTARPGAGQFSRSAETTSVDGRIPIVRARSFPTGSQNFVWQSPVTTSAVATVTVIDLRLVVSVMVAPQ
jgi:hypothetical protein